MNARGWRILVVDDEPDIGVILEARLRRLGCEVRSAADGCRGLLEAEEWHPDLIILDLLIPGIDGFTFCRLMKEREDVRGIPVIVITAQHMNIERECASMGVAACLQKPFGFDELWEKVEGALSGSGGAASGGGYGEAQKGTDSRG